MRPSPYRLNLTAQSRRPPAEAPVRWLHDSGGACVFPAKSISRRCLGITARSLPHTAHPIRSAGGDAVAAVHLPFGFLPGPRRLLARQAQHLPFLVDETQRQQAWQRFSPSRTSCAYGMRLAGICLWAIVRMAQQSHRNKKRGTKEPVIYRSTHPVSSKAPHGNPGIRGRVKQEAASP